MKIVGIDYGRRKIGVSVGDSESKFAEPVTVVRFKNSQQAVDKILQIMQVEQVGRVVIGLSEGEMAKESKEFGSQLQKKSNVPIVYYDETLSTYEAVRLSIEAGIKRKKRKNLEDAYAASIMLQNYLTSRED